MFANNLAIHDATSHQPHIIRLDGYNQLNAEQRGPRVRLEML